MQQQPGQQSFRVAMIIQSYHPHVGGAERQLAALAPLLQAKGVDINILTRRYKGLSSFENINGIPVYRLPIPGPKITASLTFTMAAQFLLYKLKPDLIHAHELLSPTTTAILAKRLYGTPIVAKVLRGGKLGDIAKLEQRQSGQKRLMVMKRQVDAFITISHEIDEELSGLNISADKRPFIPNGVDTNRFSPASKEEQTEIRRLLGLPDGLIAIFTGRLAQEKQLDKLIAIWPKVMFEQPNAALLLLGTGDQEAVLKQQAGKQIIFQGPVDDVAPFLQASDLFILPSATEGLSNALLEAMAVGLPPIVSNVGGASDLITHKQNGLLVSPNVSNELCDAVLTLLNDSPMMQQLGQQARNKVLQDYALPSVVEKIYALYTRLLFSPELLLNQHTG